MTIHANILGMIGNTPAVRLSRIAPPHAEVFVKIEAANPMGSVKDRLALGIIEAAERSGELKPGQTVIEATSGNTGIGLALVCAAKGYPLVVVMAENFSIERRKMLRFLGAKVVLSPPWAKGTGMVAVARWLARENGWYFARQFDNEAGADIHSQTTAAEILGDFGENGLHAWVTGFGTGGTLKGVARILRRRSPSTKVILAEPDNAAMVGSGVAQALDADRQPSESHPAFHPHPMQGWSPDFISKLTRDAVAQDLIDECHEVRGDDAIKCAIQLARTEGIFCGITSGAAVAVALKVAESSPPGSRILAMAADTGERYLSTPLFASISAEMDAEEEALLASAMPVITHSVAPVPDRVPGNEKRDGDMSRLFVAKTLASHPGRIVMFGLSWCEFCWSVRKMLDAFAIPYVAVDLDTPDFRTAHDVAGVRSALKDMAGTPTLPQLFLEGEKLGGCMDMLDAARCGNLQRRLAQANVPFDSNARVDPHDFLPNWVRRPEPETA